MKKNVGFSALLGIALLFSACSGPSEATVDMEKLKPEIQALEDGFAAGEKARNVDSVANYYAEDAISYNRNEPPAVGMAAIKQKIAKGFAQDSVGDYNVYKVVDLFAEGEGVTEIGSWTKMNAAGEKKENGYYMAYFEKRDGKYKCLRDMSVTENAAKPAM